MKQIGRTLVVVLAMAFAGSACATKGFVRESVGEVNDKVETLGQSLEATQQATKENAARITQVDQKADQAGAAAKTAQTVCCHSPYRGGCGGVESRRPSRRRPSD